MLGGRYEFVPNLIGDQTDTTFSAWHNCLVIKLKKVIHGDNKARKSSKVRTK